MKTSTDQDDLDINLEQIQKTNSILNSLEVKLSQYMSKSRIVTQRAPTAVTFMMPNLQLLDPTSSKKSRFDQDKISQRHNSSLHSRNVQSSNQSIRHLNQIQQDIQMYKKKIGESRGPSEGKLQELYDQRTKRLEQEIQALSQRKDKIQVDREILSKQNRRLAQKLARKQQEYNQLATRYKKQGEKASQVRRQKVESRRAKLLSQLEKERIVGQELQRQKHRLQMEDKKVKQTQMATISYQNKRPSKSGVNPRNSRSKGKSQSSLSRKYPLYNSHKNCTIQTSKSKRSVGKKH